MNEVHAIEIQTGERFAFGANWRRFLSVLNEERISEAETSLKEMLGLCSLEGMTFLDAGSGSGLFSLAARRLGAVVYSFDYDPESVRCTAELKKRYFPGDNCWTVTEASVLDTSCLSSLGKFDIVYSWGVLHHTGAMWQAMANLGELVVPQGRLFVAIYNDQGWISRYWNAIKYFYVQHRSLRWLLIMLHAPYLFGLRWIVRKATGRSKIDRGMSLWHDMIDWVGGYPFEVAKPEEIFRYYRDQGFDLAEMKTCAGRLGCCEFVFRKIDARREAVQS